MNNKKENEYFNKIAYNVGGNNNWSYFLHAHD